MKKPSQRKNVPRTESVYTPFLVKEEMGLLDFVIKSLDGISRNKAKSILTHGGVLVDGEVQTRHDFALRRSMVVEVSKKPGAKGTGLKPSPYFTVVYEDYDIIVVDKAPGILSVGVGERSLNMREQLNEYFIATHQHCRAHVVHRLDTRTSGLMVFAKNIDAQQTLINNWHNGIVLSRRYVAVVEGRMEQDHGTHESWLTDTMTLVVVSSPVDNGGKWACTHWWVVDRNDDYSLLELELETGRKNQIRVHMKDLGHSIVGDFKYGSTCDPCGRLGLHAFRLALRQPYTGEVLEFETPYPEEFVELFSERSLKE